jgi:hypothetical protein
MRPLIENVKQEIAIVPVISAAATITGPGIDRRGYRDALFTLIRGGTTGTPVDYAMNSHIEECDSDSITDGDWTDVPNGAFSETNYDSDDAGIQTLEVDLESRKAFIRQKVVLTFTSGTSPKLYAASICSLGSAYNLPVVQST